MCSEKTSKQILDWMMMGIDAGVSVDYAIHWWWHIKRMCDLFGDSGVY